MDLKGFLSNSYTEFETKQREDFISIVSEKVLKAVNDKVMSMIGKDLYNYDDLEEVNTNLDYLKHFSNYDNIKNSFLNFQKTFIVGEKIVIFKKIDPGHNNNSSRRWWIYITNYASLYYIIDTGYNTPNITDYLYIQHKFWIPKDYIYLLSNIGGTTDSNYSQRNDLNRICKILEHLRDNLFNGHYVKNNIDIHHMDVYTEKQKLEKEKIEFERRKMEEKKVLMEEKIEFERRKMEERKVLMEEKKDLQRKIDAFNGEREKYSIIARKIKLERENLAKEREELIKMKVDKINLDDVMNI
jgi:hypothetical protein